VSRRRYGRFRRGDGCHSFGWVSYGACRGNTLFRSLGFGAWTWWEPKRAILDKNRNQRYEQDTQSDKHPAALLLFDSRRWRGSTDF
jgi:hypothetical protein